MKSVSQEHALGCAVACVATRTGLDYMQALKLFARQEHAWQRGYYCDEVVSALSSAGLYYEFAHFDPALHAEILLRDGTIVFLSPDGTYPAGHYLIRAIDGWMNPWINHPRMVPIESGFQDPLPGQVGFVIYEKGAPLGRE